MLEKQSISFFAKNESGFSPTVVGSRHQDRWKKQRNEKLFGHLAPQERQKAETALKRFELVSKIDLLRHELPARIDIDHGLPTFEDALVTWRQKKQQREGHELRVLVVTPPDEVGNIAATNKGIYPPYAIWRVASYAKEKGATVKILDGTIIDEVEIAREIESFQPDLTGFSVLTPTVVPAMRLSQVAKKIGSIVVWGNDHPSQNAHETMSGRENVDVILRGDGADRWFGEIVEVMRDEKPIEDVPSASWRVEGAIRNSSFDIYDLNEAIIPDPTILSKEQYAIYTINFQAKHKARFGDVVPMVLDAMKGCGHGGARCTYCDIADLRLQEKDPMQIAAEIEMMLANYVEDGQKLLIYCTGDNFTSLALPYSQVFKEDFRIEGASDHVWLREVIDKTAHLRDRVIWFVYGRADDLVRPGVADMLEELGVGAINMGIDHFDDRMLGPNALRKGNKYGGMTPSEINRQALLIAKEKGFAVHASFVLGAPGETQKSLGNFVRGYRWMLGELGSEGTMNIEVGPLIVFKGNEIYENACRLSPAFAAKYKDADTADTDVMTRDAMKLFAPAIDFDRDIQPVVKWAKEEAIKYRIVTGGPGLKE